MSDDELLAQLELWERQAVGFYGGDIAGEQSKAMDYYLGKPFGNEDEGRSRVVSSDVWDVVEGLCPLVLKPFVSSDDVVKFDPVGPDDEDAAQQETDYINSIVVQKSDAFNELLAAVKTGLLQKNAVAKYWWETSKRTTIERYQGITDDQFALMMQDPDVTVVQHTETPGQPDPTGQPSPPTHDVVLRVSHEHGQAKYAVLPPEEFRISRDATSPNPQKAHYVAHVTKKTLSELREMGYDVKDDVQDFSPDPHMMGQYLARREGDETEYGNFQTRDPSMREVTFHDEICLVDYDGDGIAELRRICRVGKEILLNEETEEINYVSWTPYLQPFKFYGRCPADETTEIQLVKSTLWRQSLDNIYTINNNRNFVSSKVNLDDLLDNVIAGVVRVDAPGDVGGHVMAAPIQPIGGVVQPMIEYLDSAKENRTGFTRYNQGTDSNSLNKTATGVRVISEAGNQRVELISRAFAEQFLKPLMLGIHGLCRRHATQQEIVRLRGKWVPVDPRDWVTRYDMTVSVGLGNADKQMQMQAAQLLIQTQHMVSPIPGLVQPENVYNAAAKLAQSIGEKSPEKYFSDPSKQPPQPPPDPTQDPEVMFKVAEKQQKDRELDLKERQVTIQEKQFLVDSLIATGNMEANIAKAVQEPSLMGHLDRVQNQLEALQADDNPEPPAVASGAQPAPEAEVGQA